MRRKLGLGLVFLGVASIVLGAMIAYLADDWKSGIPSFYELAGAGLTLILTGAAMMLWPGKQRERVNAWAEELRHIYDEECERDLSQLRGQHHNLPVPLRRWPVVADPPGTGEELENLSNVARHITSNTPGRVFLTGDRAPARPFSSARHRWRSSGIQRMVVWFQCFCGWLTGAREKG